MTKTFLGKIRGDKQKVISVPQEVEGNTGEFVIVLPLEVAVGIVNDLKNWVGSEEDKGEYAEDIILRPIIKKIAIWEQDH